MQYGYNPLKVGLVLLAYGAGMCFVTVCTRLYPIDLIQAAQSEVHSRDDGLIALSQNINELIKINMPQR